MILLQKMLSVVDRSSENESDEGEQFSQSADEDFQEMDPQLSDLEGDWNEEEKNGKENDEDDEELDEDEDDEENEDEGTWTRKWNEELDEEDDSQDLDISNVKYGDFFEESLKKLTLKITMKIQKIYSRLKGASQIGSR